MRWLIIVALCVAGCGGSPTSPSPTPRPVPAPTPTPSPAPAPAPTITITGTITSTTTGAVVGAFVHSVNALPTRMTISAPGYVSRETTIRTTTPRVDLIPEAGFDLAFFRQLGRDDYDRSRGVPGHTTLQPLWVLTDAPSFYMEVEGAKGLSRQLALKLEAVTRRIVPMMTGGRFTVTRWETGPTPRPRQPGWIMIERKDDLSGPDSTNPCGRAYVGASDGQIWLSGDQQCRQEALMAHELGHALGFFHVDRRGAMMSPQQDWSLPSNDTPTDLERHHAALAYARPRFNTDVDRDPSSFAGLSTARLVVD